ncbi:MAG: DNA-directed RNA polymerase subunit N [Hadesarchaea archaeon]|nr:DNA-directed RNA polymerase subunit N [Hadesarchaea archaeon]
MCALRSPRSPGVPGLGPVTKNRIGDHVRVVRCITCGKLLGDKYEEFEQRVKRGQEPKRVLDELGVKRYCCRSTIITSVDLTEEIAKFKR